MRILGKDILDRGTTPDQLIELMRGGLQAYDPKTGYKIVEETPLPQLGQLPKRSPKDFMKTSKVLGGSGGTIKAEIERQVRLKYQAQFNKASSVVPRDSKLCSFTHQKGFKSYNKWRNWLNGLEFEESDWRFHIQKLVGEGDPKVVEKDLIVHRESLSPDRGSELLDALKKGGEAKTSVSKPVSLVKPDHGVYPGAVEQGNGNEVGGASEAKELSVQAEEEQVGVTKADSQAEPLATGERGESVKGTEPDKQPESSVTTKSSPQSSVADKKVCHMVKRGEYWTICYKGKVLSPIKHVRGLEYVYYLVYKMGSVVKSASLQYGDKPPDNPKKRVEIEKLLREEEIKETGMTTYHGPGEKNWSNELPEDIKKAVETYKTEEKKLKAVLLGNFYKDDSEKENIESTLELIKNELETLKQPYQASETNNNVGKKRPDNAIRNALNAAYKKIEKVSPELRNHLKTSIKTGHLCIYTPPPEWDGEWIDAPSE